jgi:HPt (histidine-containing phosphotransfer) domain-containing protein
MPPLPNDPVINVESALKRLEGKQQMLADLAKFFLEDAPQLLEQLQKGIEQESVKEVARCAHSLRGLASSFDAFPFMRVAQDEERLAKNADFAQARQLLGPLTVELDRLVEALRELIERVDGKSSQA